MKTPNEIIKILAEKSPIISVRQFGDTEEICYYCKKYQFSDDPEHSPDCLWLEMQQEKADYLDCKHPHGYECPECGLNLFLTCDKLPDKEGKYYAWQVNCFINTPAEAIGPPDSMEWKNEQESGDFWRRWVFMWTERCQWWRWEQQKKKQWELYLQREAKAAWVNRKR
jgi:hypothetical protein